MSAIANGVIDSVDGAGGSRDRTNAAIDGLDQVSTGLGGAISGLNNQLIPGMQQISGGLDEAKTGVDDKLHPRREDRQGWSG